MTALPELGNREAMKGQPKTAMEWTRSETVALAAHDCTSCHGLGLKTGRRGGSSPCNCVLRAIFRACYNRFRLCVNKEKHMTRVSLEHTGSGGARRYMWSRKDEEYIADFTLVSKRTLTAEEYKLFSAHFLLGADWRLCCRKLKMDRGNFFHAIYRIQQKLGKVFRELEPYCLYPLDEYFGASKLLDPVRIASAKLEPAPAPEPGKIRIWRDTPRPKPQPFPLLRRAA